MRNAIIYTRVSSKEQVENTSLEFQYDDIQKLATQRDIRVIKSFDDKGESAKFADRPGLIEMLEYCRKNKGRIDYLVVWKVDRLSRNQLDYYYIKRLLLDYGVSIISVTEPSLEDDSISGKVLETFSALGAEIDNITRRERSVRGMQETARSGIYPRKPPIGYVTISGRPRGEKKTEPDKPDAERFPIIQKLFRECLDKGVCGSTQLADCANTWGLRMSDGKRVYPQAIDRIIQNKFYAGLIYDPWDDKDYQGKHDAMVTPGEFEKVQLLRRGKKITGGNVRKKENPKFPLRRTVVCFSCGVSITGSSPRGNGGTYDYYHCKNKNCDMYGRAIPKVELETAFTKELKGITPKPGLLKLFKAVVEDIYREKMKTSKEVARKRRGQLKNLEDRLSRLIDIRTKDLLTDEEFLNRKKGINDEIAVLRAELSDFESPELELGKLLGFAEKFILEFPNRWQNMDLESRRGFQSAVFPSGIPYQRGVGFGTTTLGVIYAVLSQSEGLKPRLVSPRGIEPLFRD